jgi:hypothetical protein
MLAPAATPTTSTPLSSRAATRRSPALSSRGRSSSWRGATFAYTTRSAGPSPKASWATQKPALTVSNGGTGMAATSASGSSSANRWRTSANARSPVP